MAMNPIGISFMPSQENADLGPRRGAMEGDLQQAWTILSMHLPRVLGARAPSPEGLLRSRGSAALPGGMNPNAAALAALVQAGFFGPSAGGAGGFGNWGGGSSESGGGSGGGSDTSGGGGYKPNVNYQPNAPLQGGDVDLRMEERRNSFPGGGRSFRGY